MAQPSFYDIVFEHRNKEYGAYSLRKVYVRNAVIGLSVSLFLVVALCAYFYINQYAEYADDIDLDVSLLKYVNFDLDESLLEIEQPQPEPIKEDIKNEESFKITDKPVVETEVTQATPPIDTTKTQVALDSIEPEVAADKKEDSVSTEFATIVDSLPKFQGQPDAFRNYLVTKIQYPDTSYIRMMQGKLLITFVIAESGRPEQIQLDKLADTKWGADIVRMIKRAPAWQPAYRHGQPVKTFFSVPIIFAM